jgi:hypothetical protein
MKVIFSKIESPKFSRPDNTAIDCLVKVHPDCAHPYAGQTHPFTATPYDKEPHGIQLWQELMKGKHGKITPHTAPSTGEAA